MPIEYPIRLFDKYNTTLFILWITHILNILKSTTLIENKMHKTIKLILLSNDIWYDIYFECQQNIDNYLISII